MVSMAHDPDGPQTPYLGESRARVLHALQGSTEPMGVSEVARTVGLHPNTARFHLDALTDAHLATRHREEREVPGRPRWLYSAGPGAAHSGGRRSYQLLAQILSSSMTIPAGDPSSRAAQAGRAWGRRMTQPPAAGRTDVATATRKLNEVLEEIGFAPEMSAGDASRLLLHHCPFREAVDTNQEVVCAVHLGLMRGVLDTLHTSVQASSLESFVEPELCVAHLKHKAAS